VPVSCYPSPKYAAIAAALNAQFSYRAAVRPGEALAALPRAEAHDREAAARQMLKRGTYPFPTFRLGGLRCVLVADIAATLCSATPDGSQSADELSLERSAAARSRGRPRKVAPALDVREVAHVHA